MIWIIIAVYLECGFGIALALDDDNGDGNKSSLVLVVAFLVTVLLWPLFFMFALTSMIRSVAEGSRRQIVVKSPELDAKERSA